MLRIHHFMKHVCLHYPRTNASEHAMLHNMFFAPPSQNTKSVWCMLKHLNNHHGHALQCAGCVAWAGDAYHVIISMSKWVDSFLTCSSCNLFFSFCERVQSCLNLKALNHWQVNYCHIAPVTCQAAATTVSVMPGMTFPSASIFSSSLGKYGKILLDKPSSLFQNLWSWFKRPSFCLLLHWYEHPNHKLHARVLFDTICKLQYLGISEYSISFNSTFKLFYVTRSNVSHSPEDAVILSPSPNEPFHTCIFLDLIGLSWTSSLHWHLPFTIQHLDEPKSLKKLLFLFSKWQNLPDISKTLRMLQKGPRTQYEFHCCHNIVFKVWLHVRLHPIANLSRRNINETG